MSRIQPVNVLHESKRVPLGAKQCRRSHGSPWTLRCSSDLRCRMEPRCFPLRPVYRSNAKKRRSSHVAVQKKREKTSSAQPGSCFAFSEAISRIGSDHVRQKASLCDVPRLPRLPALRATLQGSLRCDALPAHVGAGGSAFWMCFFLGNHSRGRKLLGNHVCVRGEPR